MDWYEIEEWACTLNELDLEEEYYEQVKVFLATHPKVEVPQKYKTPDWIFEKSENPMQEGLENEAVSYCLDNGLNLSPRVATDFARHFAQWGAEHLKK